jgi:hypothetical protein
VPDVAGTRAAITTQLVDFKSKLDGYTYYLHERDGMIPIAKALRSLRDTAAIYGPVSSSVRVLALPAAPRFVNSSMFRASGASFAKLQQTHACLTVGELYHLGVQIGPQDVTTVTVGATALLEEYFKWTPDMKGVWVEIGVTGLDFEVVGDPVQELWLPREGASDTVYIPVKPQTPGAARLRFCLYFQNNVIQSFRLAAVVKAKLDEADPPPSDRALRLAAALDLQASTLPALGYVARLEYSLAQKLDELPYYPERALSLVANSVDDKAVITVKGDDVFAVRVNRDIKDHVTNVRTAMDEVCTDRKGPDPQYRFNIAPAKLNAGTELILKDALRKLAIAGRDLYTAVIDQATREKLKEPLAAERREIHVAHVLLEDVIPWSAIYDEEYDAVREMDAAGGPVAHDVCLAALPSKDGVLASDRCGMLPKCLLHVDQAEARRKKGDPSLLRETVVCPLHFWGFKHVIEIPPQQATNGKDIPAQRKEILAGPTTQMVAGLNAGLQSSIRHATDLDGLAQAPVAASWKCKLYHRDRIRDALNDPELDFIYFYCHARGGRSEPTTKPPVLEFRDELPGSAVLPMRPADLSTGTVWVHQPLVFLNGCGTAGFSPDALSPFITAAVQDRGAAGVVGTEIPVWEYFAGDFSLRFVQSFLAGKPAGEAMLLCRRAFLSQYNPLGLIYTLYAAAGLTLKQGQ